MNAIFCDVVDSFVLIYLNCLLAYSKTEAEHQRQVDLVWRFVKEHSLYVYPKKCFVKLEAKFLGLLARKNGIRADPAKIEVINAWRRPENITELRGFLVLSQFLQ